MARRQTPDRERLWSRLLERFAPPEDVDWLATTRRVTICLFGLAAGIATVLAIPRLEQRAAAATWPEAITIELVDAPAWVTGDLRAMLDHTALRSLTGDAFGQPELSATRQALLETGWFEDVTQVRRIRPALVRIEARYVRPAAVVRDDTGDHLVDGRGHLLPRSFPRDGAKRQIVIDGAHFDRPVTTGVAWPGADVVAGLRLLRVFDEKPWREQVYAINVSAYLEQETLVIVTDQRARIVWGNAPGDETALEVTANGKLAYLDQAFAHFGRIDTGHQGELRFYEQGYFAE